MTLVPRCSGIRWPCLAEIRNRILHTASFMELHGVVGVQWTWNIFASQIAHLYRSFSIEPFSDGVSTEGRRIRRICYPKAWYSLMKQRQIWHKIGQVCSKTWHSTCQVCSTVTAILAMVPYRQMQCTAIWNGGVVPFCFIKSFNSLWPHIHGTWQICVEAGTKHVEFGSDRARISLRTGLINKPPIHKVTWHLQHLNVQSTDNCPGWTLL